MNYPINIHLLLICWGTFLFSGCIAGQHRSYRDKVETSNFQATAVERMVSAIKQDGMVLLEESFNDASLAERGWYDGGTENVTVAFDTDLQSQVLEVQFHKGSTKPQNSPLRYLFNEVEVLYFRYLIKYADNWSWTKNYGPHEFYFLTNGNHRWTGPAKTRLTLYVETNKGRPRIKIQDAENIDVTRIKQNIVDVTESRAVAGCNGKVGEGRDSCYQFKGGWLNGKSWSVFTGKLQNNRWYQVEAFVKMNSIQSGKGMPDGILSLWLDEKLVLIQNDVLFRTGVQADLKFNQFMIGPWFHGGVPHNQRFWIGNLLIKTVNHTFRH